MWEREMQRLNFHNQYRQNNGHDNYSLDPCTCSQTGKRLWAVMVNYSLLLVTDNICLNLRNQHLSIIVNSVNSQTAANTFPMNFQENVNIMTQLM